MKWRNWVRFFFESREQSDGWRKIALLFAFNDKSDYLIFLFFECAFIKLLFLLLSLLQAFEKLSDPTKSEEEYRKKSRNNLYPKMNEKTVSKLKSSLFRNSAFYPFCCVRFSCHLLRHWIGHQISKLKVFEGSNQKKFDQIVLQFRIELKCFQYLISNNK